MISEGRKKLYFISHTHEKLCISLCDAKNYQSHFSVQCLTNNKMHLTLVSFVYEVTWSTQKSIRDFNISISFRSILNEILSLSCFILCSLFLLCHSGMNQCIGTCDTMNLNIWIFADIVLQYYFPFLARYCSVLDRTSITSIKTQYETLIRATNTIQQ